MGKERRIYYSSITLQIWNELYWSTLGGGMFYGVGVLQGNNFHINKTLVICYVLYEGKAEDMVNTIEQMRKKGQFGSTTISFNYAPPQIIEGQQVNITVDGDLSIKLSILPRLTNQIRFFQTIMDDNNLNKSDEDI